MVKKAPHLYYSLLVLLLISPRLLADAIPIEFTSNALATDTSLDFILLFIGTMVILLELILPTYGAFSVLGLIFISYALYSLLVNNPLLAKHAWPMLIAILVIDLCFLSLSIAMAIKAHRRKVVSGREALLGQTATVVSDFQQHQGWVRIEGELWQAYAKQSFRQGDTVRIVKVDDLKLFVTSLTA